MFDLLNPDPATVIAAQRITKARTELVMSHRFYGVLVSNTEPVITRKVETAATNGRQHFWNPDFVATLSQEQLLFVQRHESEHDARHHSTRREGRDPLKWNEAGDYSINIDLIDEGGVPPPGVLVDAKYRGWSAEDIYRARELDKARQQKQEQEQQQQQQPQDGDDESDDDQQNGGAGDDEQDDTDDSQGDDQGDAGDEDQDGDQSEGQGDGDDEGETSDQGEGQGEGDADGEAEGQGTGEGDGQDGDEGQGGQGSGSGDAQSDDAADGQGGDADGEGEGEAGQAKPVVGDVGGCGEVLDAAEEPADLAAEDAKWERVTRQAVAMAKAIGQLPGHFSREIERRNQPTQDWRETLRAWFDQGALRTETWNRPNRRFIGSGLVLPGSQRDGVNKAVFLIDTSASCDDVALACVREEAQAALDDGAIEEAVVVYGDTRVTRVDTFRTGDELEFDPRGGGGTDMKPLFKYAADEHSDASLIVCFTDLYIGDPGPEPQCPTLWAVHGYPDAVRQLCANAPWGAPAIDVGAH